MKFRVLVCLVSLLLLFSYLVLPARAHDFIYQPEDPSRTNEPDSPNIDNWVMWQWQQGQEVSWWIAPSSDPDFRNQVVAAMGFWSMNVPGLHYTANEAPDALGANIRFFYETGCPNPPGSWVLGVNDPDGWINRPPNGPENASYIWRTNICINPNPNPGNPPGNSDWTAVGRTAIISHELGHSYGLHEQYIPGGQCWPYTTSVMDTARLNANVQFEPCDTVPDYGLVQGPTLLDLQRVQAYWMQGDNGHYRTGDVIIFGVASTPSNPNHYGHRTIAEFKWADFTWTEAYHLIAVYFSPDNINWGAPFLTQDIYPEVGAHYLTQPRALGLTVDRNDPLNPQPAGYYQACAWGRSLPFGSWTTIRCSNVIQLE